MARLPQPGGDAGNWGNILNEYLAQSHKTDGSLKDNSVTTSALAPNSVTAATISDDSITKTKLTPAVRAELEAKLDQSAVDARVTAVGNSVYATTAQVPTGGVRAVGKGELMINARDYGIVGDGSDETSAITALFAAALLLNPVAGAISGTTYRTPTIYFPAGTYSWSTKIVADLAVSAPANRDRRRLIIRGDGEGATVFKPTHTSDAALHVKGGLLTMSGIRWIGTGSNSFLKLGDPVAGTSYVNQFKVSDCAFHNGGDMIVFDWCFDGAFQDILFSSVAANKSAVVVNPHADDNSNNISFIRCHFEPASGSGVTYCKVRGGALTAQKHSQFNFVSCHFETRRYNATAFDIEYANSFNCTGTRFAQNQDTGATSTPDTALPLFRIVNMNGFALSDCVVARVATSTTDTWLNKLFAVGGSARSIRASGTFFAPYTTSATESKSNLWQSDATVAYIPDGTSVIEFGEGCSIGNRDAPKVSDDVLTIASPVARNRTWSVKIDDANAQQLRTYYSNDATTLDSSSSYKLGLGTDGVLSLRNGLATATAATIANNGTATFDLVGNNNGSKRAMYIVTARTSSAQTWALVYSSGTALSIIAIGSDMAAATANPATAGKFNVYLDGSSRLNVNNLFGSSALVSSLPIGF